MDKLKIALLFGGKSAEHEVSILSARNIISGLDSKKYEVILIGIDKLGNFHLMNSLSENIKFIPNGLSNIAITLQNNKTILIDNNDLSKKHEIDIIFPILHGPNGEDGSIQGFAKTLNTPCVGAGILSSAICMDKDITKRLLLQAGIKVAPYVAFTRPEYEQKRDKLFNNLKFPIYIKPANMGSSVGISKVNNIEELDEAVTLAFKYDSKLLAETGILGREIECAILGNDNLIASNIGEVITDDKFYDYQKKYIDENGVKLAIPANINKDIEEKIQAIAKEAFKILECKVMARVDMFLENNGDIYINELNTIPGFTNYSMYFKLLELSGISLTNLLDELINLTLKEYQY